jgi:hypothetical protein
MIHTEEERFTKWRSKSVMAYPLKRIIVLNLINGTDATRIVVVVVVVVVVIGSHPTQQVQ